jgi:hypothetical protein
MMNKFFMTFFMCAISAFTLSAQRIHTYYSYASEMHLAQSNLKFANNPANFQKIMRFSYLPNINVLYHLTVGKHIDLSGGVAVNNVGLIYTDSIKQKHRSINLGLPLALSLGSLGKNDVWSVWAGYEPEYFWHYKNKQFKNNIKFKQNDYVSPTTVRRGTGVSVGVGYKDYYFRVKYYLNDFFNDNYVAANGTMPYKNSQSNIYFLAFGSNTAFGKYKPKQLRKATDRIDNPTLTLR